MKKKLIFATLLTLITIGAWSFNVPEEPNYCIHQEENNTDYCNYISAGGVLKGKKLWCQSTPGGFPQEKYCIGNSTHPQ